MDIGKRGREVGKYKVNGGDKKKLLTSRYSKYKYDYYLQSCQNIEINFTQISNSNF
jgi:hypothetical protein